MTFLSKLKLGIKIKYDIMGFTTLTHLIESIELNPDTHVHYWGE